MNTIEQAQETQARRDNAAKELEAIHLEMIGEFDCAENQFATQQWVKSIARTFIICGAPQPRIATMVLDGVWLYFKLVVSFPPKKDESNREYVKRIGAWLANESRKGTCP